MLNVSVNIGLAKMRLYGFFVTYRSLEVEFETEIEKAVPDSTSHFISMDCKNFLLDTFAVSTNKIG